MQSLQAAKTKQPPPVAPSFEGSTQLQRMAAQWLNIQCTMVKEVQTAQLICLQLEARRLHSLANWPASVPERSTVPRDVLKCLREDKHQVRSIKSSQGEKLDLLCFPLLNTAHFRYAIVLTMSSRSELMQRSVLNMLQWGRQWFRFAYTQPEPATSVSHMALWDTASRCLEHSELNSASNALVAQLATQLRCVRVSYGERRSRQIQLKAISHTASFNRKTESIKRLQAAMEEAIEQDSMLQIPESVAGKKQQTTAHQVLADNSSNACICTVPIAADDRLFACITLERPLERPFEAAEINYIEQLTALLSSHFYMLQELASNPLQKVSRKCRDLIQRLGGAGHSGFKLKAGLAALAVLFLLFAEGDYKVSSPAVIEGRVQRAVVAPLEGFLASAEVRAGDSVSKGQMMGQLDDKDLKLEQLSISSEQQELLGSYREAMAEHDNAKVSVLGARIEQANARMQLVNAQLKRTRLIAPFDGMVIEGDLSQSLGSPVNKGDILFKIAPLDDYRIILEVDEGDIRNIEPGLTGTVVLTSLPGEKFAVTVEKVTSLSTAEDSSNYFRVEARLEQHSSELRPGMEGAGKIELGQRKLLWIWTHKLSDWIRLKTWAWMP